MRLLVSFSKFICLNSIQDFKENSTVINYKSAVDVNKFIKLGFTPEMPPYFRLLPIIGTVSNSNQFRFMLIELQDDVVCIFYKSVTLFHNQQVKIFGLPISENNKRDSEELIFNHLKGLDITKFLITDSEQTHLFDTMGEPVGYSDYFYDFEIHNVLNSKYKHHHKVHKIYNNPDFKVVIFRGKMMADVQPVIDLWDEWCDGLKYLVTDKRRYKEYINLLLCEDKDLYKTIIYYKGKPVSVRIWYYYEPLEMCRSFYNVHSAKTCAEEIYPTMKHITHIQKYIMADYIDKNIHARYVYIAGAGHDCDVCQLRKHKEEISQGKIEYYLCK